MMYCVRCGKPINVTSGVCSCGVTTNGQQTGMYFLVTTDGLLVEIRDLLKTIKDDIERMNS